MKRKSCCITGHREIPENRIEYVKARVRDEILKAIENGYTYFLSGFAEGVDLYFCAIVAELKKDYPQITLEAVIPYRNRMKTKDKEFHRLIAECDAIGVHSEEYTKSCYMKRNRIMVQNSDMVIAVYDGRESGGTLFTMRYARAMGKALSIIEI